MSYVIIVQLIIKTVVNYVSAANSFVTISTHGAVVNS